jgi:hypothetical protein
LVALSTIQCTCLLSSNLPAWVRYRLSCRMIIDDAFLYNYKAGTRLNGVHGRWLEQDYRLLVYSLQGLDSRVLDT